LLPTLTTTSIKSSPYHCCETKEPRGCPSWHHLTSPHKVHDTTRPLDGFLPLATACTIVQLATVATSWQEPSRKTLSDRTLEPTCALRIPATGKAASKPDHFFLNFFPFSFVYVKNGGVLKGVVSESYQEPAANQAGQGKSRQPSDHCFRLEEPAVHNTTQQLRTIMYRRTANHPPHATQAHLGPADPLGMALTTLERRGQIGSHDKGLGLSSQILVCRHSMTGGGS
jgi:hypothetical protein